MKCEASIVNFCLPEQMLSVADLPFPAVRLFSLYGKEGTKRGNHAHRKCSQFMFLNLGAVGILCERGTEAVFTLDNGMKGLHVPPMHWVEVKFLGDAILHVLCDMPYDERDYIRNYSDFVRCISL